MAGASSNWAGNITYGARTLHEPTTVAQLQDIVRRADKVRAIGSRHCFNDISVTPGDLVSMRGLNRLIGVDHAAGAATIEGGITYGELCPLLAAEGVALHNLASLPHISVVGACSTATHGSGNGNRNLATAVRALEIVTADGEVVHMARGDADFDGAVVALGALGLVSRLTLDVQPSFEVRQNIYRDLPFEALLDNFDTITGAAYSVSCFTRWQGDDVEQVWLKALADAPEPGADFFGAWPADRPYHPISSVDPAPATEQQGRPGPWYDRLPHFRMDFLPSVGAELQSEYFVDRKDGVAALRALRAIQDRIAPLLLVSEIRTMAADTLWLSPNYEADSVAFHFTFKPDWPALSELLPVIEAALAPFRVRPHWGKLFTMAPAQYARHYPRLGAFRDLAHRLDPQGKFRNDFVQRTLFAA